MSDSHDIIADVVADRAPGTSDTVTNLRSGLPFQAEVEEIQDIELNTELGRDPRESVTLHVQRPGDKCITAGDRLQVTILGRTVVLVALSGRRRDKPACPLVAFGCMYETDKDS